MQSYRRIRTRWLFNLTNRIKISFVWEFFEKLIGQFVSGRLNRFNRKYERSFFPRSNIWFQLWNINLGGNRHRPLSLNSRSKRWPYRFYESCRKITLALFSLVHRVKMLRNNNLGEQSYQKDWLTILLEIASELILRENIKSTISGYSRNIRFFLSKKKKQLTRIIWFLFEWLIGSIKMQNFSAQYRW